MADAAPPPSDPFASAKTNLRDTVKWMATTFAGLAAVVLAGTSLTGVSHLKGAHLTGALVAGGLGLICVILAAGVMLRLLTAESFFVSDLNDRAHAKLRGFLEAHAGDVLPAEFENVGRLLDLRATAIKTVRAYVNNLNAPEYIAANQFLSNITSPLSRLTNLAHFEVMRSNLKDSEPILFLLAIGALVGLGAFAVLTGSYKDSNGENADASIITFIPGKQWENVGAALGKICGDTGPSKVQLLSAPDPSWVRIRLLSPENCAGVILTLPASFIRAGVTPNS